MRRSSRLLTVILARNRRWSAYLRLPNEFGMVCIGTELPVASGLRSSVYLSGWEYNRVLQADPTEPRNSALPASILWNGSHQLWMFETVFCTRESFENEVAPTDVLGWVNGTVLRDLTDEEF